MNLLVVGGTGVLSTAVVQEALKKGINVSIINRGNRMERIPKGATFLKADVHEEQKVRNLVRGKHYDSVIDFICFNKEQLEYSVNLFKDFADQYVYISTTCVYNAEIPGIKTENSPKVLKSWPYSRNKWAGEEFIIDHAQKTGLKYTIVRPCVTYDNTRIPYGIMPPYGWHWTLAARIKANKPVVSIGGGQNKWNLMRVEDFAVGVVGLLGNPLALNQAFNICGDTAYTWNEVLEVVGKYVGKKPIIYEMPKEEYAKAYPEQAERLNGRTLDYVCSNEKIKNLIPNYGDTYSLEEGIFKTLKYYEEHNYEKGIDWEFDSRQDGIIFRDIKKQGGDVSKYNLRFIDYLGNATSKDKLAYRIGFSHNNLFILLIRLKKQLSRHLRHLIPK